MARDLRGFIQLLEKRGQLRRVRALVDPDLELAEIAQRARQSNTVGNPEQSRGAHGYALDGQQLPGRGH